MIAVAEIAGNLFKFQYDNTLSKESATFGSTNVSFKFQYDNTLRESRINLYFAV